MKKIYLAGPFFNEEENAVYDKMLAKMRELGYEVFAPREFELEGREEDNFNWAKGIFEGDVKAINEADEVWVLYHGMYSDSGTAWECGYAYGTGKKVKVFLPMSAEEKPKFSLMIVNGCEEYCFIEDFLGEGKTQVDFNLS